MTAVAEFVAPPPPTASAVLARRPADPLIVTSWRPAPGGETLTQGFEVIRWMEACLVHTEGEWRGRPFRLLLWQKRLILELFTLEPDPEWIPPVDEPDRRRTFRDGLRRKYREAFITVPKKNGKTELAAAIALYLLIGDGEPSPKGVFVAGSLKQAGVSFRPAQTMILESPILRQVAGERNVGDLVIEIPSIPGSRLERVAAEAGTNDGPSLHFGVLDEVHEYQGEAGTKVHGVVTNAGAARRNSLFVSISTVGADAEDEEQVWVQLWNRGWSAAADPDSDPRFYFFATQAPAGSDWRDREAWEQANPSAGVTVSWSFYEGEWAKGEAWCNRYYRNRPPGLVEDAWLEPEAWSTCEGDPTFTATEPAYACVRIDPDHRQAAVALAQRQGERVVLRVRPFPRTPLEEGDFVDAEDLEAYIRELHRRYPARVLAAVRHTPRGREQVLAREGPEVLYHGAFFESSAQRLRRDGIVLVDQPQSQARLGEAAETLKTLVANSAVTHDGDDLLARHVGHVVGKQGDRYVRIQPPSGSGRRITLAIAAMFAAHRAVTAQRPPSRAIRRPRRTA